MITTKKQTSKLWLVQFGGWAIVHPPSLTRIGKKMNIADKLIKGSIELDNDELKFLLWNSLIQLSSHYDNVTTTEEESFNIEQMLSALETQQGTLV